MKKILILSIILLLSFGLNIKAQVTITPANPISNLCVGNSTYIPLSTITITETNNADITDVTNGTLVFTMPTGFQLKPSTGNITIQGTGVSNINSFAITSTTITINYNAENLTTGFTISHLEVQSTLLQGTPVNLLFDASSTGVVAGLTTTSSIASFTSANTPMITNLFSTGSPICEGQTASFFAVGMSIDEFEFVLKQGASTINTQSFSSTPFYTTSNTLLAGNYTIEVRGKNNTSGCISIISSTSLTITARPSPPSVTNGNNQSYCLNTSNSTNIGVSGTGVRWFTNSALTSEIFALAGNNNPTLAQLGINTSNVGVNTLFVTQTIGSCQSIASVLNIQILALPTINVTNTTIPICFGKTVTFTATGTSEYRFEIMQGVTSIAVQNYSPTNTYTTSTLLPAGSYNMNVLGKDVNGCLSTQTSIPFVINSLPTNVTITGGNLKSFCTGTAVSTLVAASGSGTIKWFSDANLTNLLTSGTSVSLSSLNISTAFPSTNTIYVINDNGTCFSNAEILTINILNSPVVILSSNDADNIICQGQTITFSAGGTATQFSVDLKIAGTSQSGFPTAFSTSNTYTISNSLSANDNYSLIIRGRLPNGCITISNEIFFQIKSVPTVTFTWPGTPSYVNTNNTPIDLSTSVTPTGGVFSGNGVSGTDFTPSIAGIGTHIITYTYTTPNGCAVSQQLSVSVSNAGFIVPSFFCSDAGDFGPIVRSDVSPACITQSVSSNSSFLTSNSGNGGTDPIIFSGGNYVFRPNNVAIPTGQDFVQWNGAIFFNSTSNGYPNPPCPSYGYAISTTIFRTPNPIISGVTNVCQNATNVSYSVPLVAGNTYVWSVTGGTIVGSNTGNSISVNWGSAGVGNVIVVQTTNYTTPIVASCAKNTSMNIIIQAPPSPNIFPAAGPACEFTTGNVYSVSNVIGNTYTWSLPLGGGIITSGQGTNSITVDWGGANVNQRTIQVQQTSGTCSGTDTRTIFIRDTPAPTITGNISVCANSMETYNVSFPALIGSPAVLYEWIVTGGTITGSNTSNSISVNWGTGSVGNVQVKVKGDYTNVICEGSTSLGITIRVVPTPNMNIGGICENSTGNTFSVTSPVLGSTYTWAVTGGTISGSNTGNTILIDWGVSGSGSVTLTETDANGCIGSIIRSIAIRARPTPTVVSSHSTSLCANTNGVTYNVTNSIFSSYLWSVTGGGTIISGQGTSQITVDWGGISGNVAVQETRFGCVGSHSRNITILTSPIPPLLGASSVCELNPQTYTTSGTGTFSWIVTGGTITSGQNTTQISVLWGTAGTGNVQVTNVDVNGCEGSSNQNITINPLPNPSIVSSLGVGVNAACAGQNGITYSVTSIGGHNYSWNVVGGSIVSGANTNAIVVNWGTGASGSVSVTQTNTTTNCTKNTLQNITIYPLPNPTITGNFAVCANTTQSYNVPNILGQTYTWNVVGGSITSGQNSNSVNVNWGSNPIGAKIELTQTNTTTNPNCSNLISQNINILPPPTPNIAGNNAVCEMQTGVIYNVPFEIGSSYSWNVTDGIIVATTPSNNEVTINWGTNGTGNVSVTQTNANGCINTNVLNVTINPLPNPVIANNNPVCANSTNHIYSTNLVTGSSYLWDVTGGVITAGQNTNQITVSWNNAGAGIVKVTETITTTNCVKITSNNITINPLPNPNINGNFNVCANSTSVYNVTNVIGNTYNWNVVGGTFTGQGTNQITVNWGNNPVGAKVEVTQTITATNCSLLNSKNIIIFALPNPNITGDNTSCELSNNNVYSTIQTPLNGYTWTITPAGSATFTGQGTNQININWNNVDVAGTPSVRTITLLQNNPDGCNTIITRNVTINPLPAPTITGSANVCATSNHLYSAPSIPNNTYLWDVTNGVITSGQNTNQISVTWNTGFPSGNVKLTQTINATDCAKIVNLPVIINPLPNPIITTTNNNFSVCANSTTVYNVSNVVGNTYNWQVVGGTFTGQGTNQITVTWGSNPIGAKVEITQTDNNFITNCNKLSTQNITILPLPTPSITGVSQVCEDNIYTYSTSPVAGHTYIWDIKDGVFIGASNGNIISVRWDNPSNNQFVKLTQTSNTNPACSQTVEIQTLVVNPVPYNTITIANTCLGDITTFTPDITSSDWSWEWTFPDNTTSTLPNPTKVFPNTGNFFVKVRTTNNITGCSYLQENIPFEINPVPVANFRFLGSCVGSPTQFTDLSSVANTNGSVIVNWAWNFGDNSPIVSVPSPLHNYSAGSYDATLTVTTNKGCTHSVTKRVNAFPSVTPTDTNPYFEGFETNTHGWIAEGQNSTWTLAIPTNPNRNIKINAGRMWTTGLNNNYSNNQQSYVESPCISLSQLARPMIAFKKWTDVDENVDGVVVTYTIDDGQTWNVLGNIDEGDNWYETSAILGQPADGIVNPLQIGWGKNNTSIVPATNIDKWLNARFPLDLVKQQAGNNPVRFRINFGSNGDNPPRILDGFAFDDVFIGNRQTKVLVEHFTSLSSKGATIASENTFTANFPNVAQDELVLLTYQTQLEGENILYNQNQGDVTARSLYYGLAVIPRASVHGKVNLNQPFSTSGTREYTRQSLAAPAFRIEIEFPTIPNNALNINAKITALQNYSKKIVVHTVLVERIVTSTQIGETGNFQYRNVVRRMLPSAAGNTIFLSQSAPWLTGAANARNFPQSTPLYDITGNFPDAIKFYNWNNLAVVVFVQDYDSKVILQSQIASPSILPPLVSSMADEGKMQCSIYPNPTSESVFIGFDEAINHDYQWEIHNLQGVKVGEGKIENGERGKRLDVSKYAKGMYLIKIIEPKSKNFWINKLQIQ